jgi:hypothetical protein|tara:strand:+ start:502 stop:909 length:408 start_codon:yes stop_codon:yes gene_type:complete
VTIYEEAKNYLLENERVIMNVFASIFCQIDAERSSLSEKEKDSISAYYAVISHKLLSNDTLVTKIENKIKSNEDLKLTEFDNELATAILTFSKINELERRGYIKISRKNGSEFLLELTEKGKEKSRQISKDIREA